MKIIDRIAEYIENKLPNPSPFFRILNFFESNPQIIEDKSFSNMGEWYRLEYIFSHKQILKFNLYSHNKNKELIYEDVSKIEVIRLMNVFIDCRIYFNYEDTSEQFYILNDVYDIDIKIKTGE